MVEVRFTERGPKTKVALRHMKLPDAEGAADMKEGWSWALDSLRAYLETGEPVKWEDWLAAKRRS